MVVARTSFREARVELSSASILPEYPTTSAASRAASLRTVRSMALSRVNAPFLAENCTNPFSKGAALRWPQRNNQGRRMAASSLFIGSVEGQFALLPKGVWLPSVPERLR